LAAHAAGHERRATDSGRAKRVALLVMAAHVQAVHGLAPAAEPAPARGPGRMNRAAVVTAAVAGGGIAILAGVAPLTAMLGALGALALVGAVARIVHLVRNRGPPVDAGTPLAGRAAERNRIARMLIQAPLFTVPMQL